MLEFTDFEIVLLTSSFAFAVLGALAGVFSVFINESSVKEFSKRIVLGIFYSLVAGLLVTSMMIEISTPSPKELFIANSLFSLLFGFWGGRSANRKIDDKQKAQKLFHDVMSAKSVDEMSAIVSVKSQ